MTKLLSHSSKAILDAWLADEGGVYLLGDPERLAIATELENFDD